MTLPTFVWAHDLLSCVDHEDTIHLIDWTVPEKLARVVRYDARGHGRALAQYVDRAYRWSALVDDMLRAAGEGPFVAGGIGMGAVTAVGAAIRAPKRLSGLVLAAPPAGWGCRAAKAAEYEELAVAVKERGAVALSEAWPVAGQPRYLTNAFNGPAELVTRHLFGMETEALPSILRGAAMSDLDAKDDVHNLIIPTLILAWEGDPGHPLRVAEELASLMIQNELHVARDLGGILEWPSVIADFLDRI